MKIIIYALFLILLTNLSYAQWVQSNGPWQGNVNCFVNTTTDAVLAGTNGDGIYTSTDSGNKWKPANTIGLSNNNVKCFLWSETNLFAGTDGGVFLSTNNGSSWFAVNSGIYDLSIKTLVKLGPNIYAGTGSGVFITTNNGGSWYNSSYSFTEVINSLAVSGITIFAGTNVGVFKSTDNGSNWASANFGLISQHVNNLIVIGSTIFAGTSYLPGAESVYKSTDEGNIWAPAGLPDLSVFSISQLSSDLYAGTSSGIYRSSDNGGSWSPMPGMTGKQINSFHPSGPNIVAGSLEGIFISTDGGTVWDAVGYKSTYVWSIDEAGPNLWATAYPNDVYMSTNNGNSWLRRTSDLNAAYRYVDIMSTESNTYVAYINNNLTNTGVYNTSNNGLNWNWMTGILNRSINCIEVPSDSLLFLGLYYKDANYGFYGYNPPPNFFRRLLNVGVWDIAMKDGNIFAATYDGIFKSTDNGVDWINSGISGNKLAVSGNNIYAVSTDYSNGRGIYKSSDNGVTWNSLGLTEKNIVGLAVFDNIIIAGVFNEGFFVSSDNGANWYSRNEGLDSIPYNISDLVIKDGNIYSSIDGLSIWKRSLSSITDVEEMSAAGPRTFLLMQNYPNPFNPTTTIKYSIAAQSNVIIKIFDALGREVESLLNEEKPAGNYELNWNAENLPSGIYFYRIQAGSFIQTKKMILMK